METTTIRPSVLSWSGVMAVFVNGVGVMLAISSFAQADGSMGRIVSIAIAVVPIAVTVWFYAGTRLDIRDGEYRMRRWGRTRRFHAADARLVIDVKFFVGQGQAAGRWGSDSRLIVMGQGGTRLLSCAGAVWSRESRNRIAADLAGHGVKVETVADPIRSGRLAVAYPGSLALFDRYPMLLLSIPVLAFVVVVTVAWIVHAIATGPA